jgi:hypothetical protein
MKLHSSIEICLYIKHIQIVKDYLYIKKIMSVFLQVTIKISTTILKKIVFKNISPLYISHCKK